MTPDEQWCPECDSRDYRAEVERLKAELAAAEAREVRRASAAKLEQDEREATIERLTRERDDLKAELLDMGDEKERQYARAEKAEAERDAARADRRAAMERVRESCAEAVREYDLEARVRVERVNLAALEDKP